MQGPDEGKDPEVGSDASSDENKETQLIEDEIIYGSPEAKTALSFRKRQMQKRGIEMTQQVCSSIKRYWQADGAKCRKVCIDRVNYRFNKRKFQCFRKTKQESSSKSKVCNFGG